mmetsp:Transcript_12592/g.39173  ORF Transcript_12592/g.39173 Transcript_12592/m.39173 type:complete len:210 (+) Transcript_12592:591-1220(+)
MRESIGIDASRIRLSVGCRGTVLPRDAGPSESLSKSSDQPRRIIVPSGSVGDESDERSPPIHGCSSSSATDARAAASRSKHRLRKLSQSGVMSSGMLVGRPLELPMKNMALYTLSKVSFHGGRPPLSISTTVHPRLHTSALVPYASLRMTSGAIQYGEPTRLAQPCWLWLAASASALEQPKSPSLATPLPSMRMFSPLMSRCTMPRSCR